MALIQGSSLGDVLQGGTGSDTLVGGSGADTYVFSYGSGQDVIVGEGLWSQDDVLWMPAVRMDAVGAAYSGSDLQISLVDGSSLRLANWSSAWSRVHQFQLEDSWAEIGGAGADWLDGRSHNEKVCLWGMEGDDSLVGSANADVLDGGGGADMIWGGSGGSDTLSGGAGNDTFFFGGTDGADCLADVAAGDVVNLYDLQAAQVQASLQGTDILLTAGSGAQLRLTNAYTSVAQGGVRFGFAGGDVRTLTSNGWSSGASSNSTFSIQFDYRFDSSGFFRDHPERQAILQQAAYEWTRHIGDEFADVPAGTTLHISNPVTGADETFAADAPIDDVLVFVGAANISNPAHGGPAAYYTVGSSLDQRWNSTTNFEPWVGSITFDTSPTYSDGSSLGWFFDPTPVDASDVVSAGAGKEDLLSVAIHEIGHVLGVVGGGSVNAFDRWRSGSYFVGPSAVAANGGRSVLLIDDTHPDGYRGGFSQEVAMAYGGYTTVGHRVTPSSIDLGLLSDIGYTIR